MRIPKNFQHTLIFKLIIGVGMTLFLCLSIWAYFNIEYQRKKLMDHLLAETVRLGNTIKLGTHYAMMTNARADINQIINNIGRQKEIRNIRIYNKDGQIKYSNQLDEVDQTTNIKAEACDVCHRFDPPVYRLGNDKMTRLFTSKKGRRFIGIITPIMNEPGCATDACHVHPEDKKVLGALDVVISMAKTDREILVFERGIILLALTMFLVTATLITIVMLKFVNQPIKQLIGEARRIAHGNYVSRTDILRDDEIGQLATAFNEMSDTIVKNQAELNRQKDEYQTLFEMVPCDITVHDREFRLINFNRRFAEKFNPVAGEHCYVIYKGRNQKCDDCPVEQTFADGQPHFGEETGINKEGQVLHWLVVTSPLKDADGRIAAVMEMNLDMTQLREMEDKVQRYEKKYQAIFNNIPNPVFVVDAEFLTIQDCNNSVSGVYGYEKSAIIGKSFLSIFMDDNKKTVEETIHTSPILNQVKHRTHDGQALFVNIRISPGESEGRKVYLITTSDVTKRLEVEQQLIQASKMATLGEMATGVAHELNQPLSVIKTASSFFMKKVRKKELIKEEILMTLTEEIDSHIRRAVKIINHMREFGRKSDLEKQSVLLNDVLMRAFEIFSQQLKVRGIDAVWEMDETLPLIYADPARLEQVFINLLINARDAIEDRWEGTPPAEMIAGADKKIILRTYADGDNVCIEVEDTGSGIPPEVQEKVFEPFFTTKEVGKGTGLGLSISYGIIKDNGGEIRAENRDSGACFIMTFPRQDE